MIGKAIGIGYPKYFDMTFSVTWDRPGRIKMVDWVYSEQIILPLNESIRRSINEHNVIRGSVYYEHR